jgi:hypothetical protein
MGTEGLDLCFAEAEMPFDVGDIQDQWGGVVGFTGWDSVVRSSNLIGGTGGLDSTQSSVVVIADPLGVFSR